MYVFSTALYFSLTDASQIEVQWSAHFGAHLDTPTLPPVLAVHWSTALQWHCWCTAVTQHFDLGIKVVLEGHSRCPDCHDLSECHHLYKFNSVHFDSEKLSVETLWDHLKWLRMLGLCHYPILMWYTIYTTNFKILSFQYSVRHVTRLENCI